MNSDGAAAAVAHEVERFVRIQWHSDSAPTTEYERYWRSRIAPGKRTVSQLGAFMMAFLGYQYEHGEAWLTETRQQYSATRSDC